MSVVARLEIEPESIFGYSWPTVLGISFRVRQVNSSVLKFLVQVQRDYKA